MLVELIITNVGLIVSIASILSLGALVLKKGGDKTTRFAFLGVTLSVAIFQAAHLLGINEIEPQQSRAYLMGTTATLMLVAFTTHVVYLMLGEAVKRRFLIYSIYGVAFGLLIYFNLFPAHFLRTSEPKLYLPNYYAPGPFYWLLIAFLTVVVATFLFHLISAYTKSDDPLFKNRLKYFISGTAASYFFGSLAFFLVYDIKVDPIFMVFAGIYTAPFAYGIIRYRMMNIEIIAKRALLYASLIVFAGFILSAINFFNQYLAVKVSGFPPWLIPAISAVLIVGLGAFIWRKIREADALKYEFITVVTHKFRTPLTYIKWSAEALRATSDEERRKESLSRINQATEKMVDLTETLIGLTDYDSSAHLYKIEPVDLEVLAAEATMGLSNQLKDKNIALSAEISKDLAARADYRRLQSVIHTLVENAITYTPANGKIEILGNEENGKVALSIKDSGIGLSREEIHHIFDKFFRGKRARATDTEGLGVGLYVARNIMDRLGGEITAESAGENKGATFTLRLPMAKVTKEKMNK